MAVGRVAFAGYPAAAFEPVEDARDGGGVERGAFCQGAWTERTVAGDEVEAIEVDVVEPGARADLVVEQGQLDAQRAQRLLDRRGQPPPTPRRVRIA